MQLAPTVKELKKTWGEKIVFVEFDVSQDKYQKIAQKNNIRAVPTMHFIGKDGKMKKELIGALPKELIEAELKKLTE